MSLSIFYFLSGAFFFNHARMISLSDYVSQNHSKTKGKKRSWKRLSHRFKIEDFFKSYKENKKDTSFIPPSYFLWRSKRKESITTPINHHFRYQ